jgi:predicted ABC-type sugar transport system permease subunit
MLLMGGAAVSCLSGLSLAAVLAVTLGWRTGWTAGALMGLPLALVCGLSLVVNELDYRWYGKGVST